MTNNSGVLMLLALLLIIAHGQFLTPYCGNNFRVLTTNPALAFLAVTQFNNVLSNIFRAQSLLLLTTSLYVMK